MDAIEINDDTIEMIEDYLTSSNNSSYQNVRLFVNRRVPYYFIRGYVVRPPYGSWPEPAIFPEYIFAKNFVHDPNKIKTDWDTIVYN